MKKILKVIRIIVAIAVLYYTYDYFVNKNFNNLIILGLAINSFIDAIDRLLSEKRNWYIIIFQMFIAVMIGYIYFVGGLVH